MFQLCLFVVIHLNNQSKEDRQVTIEAQKSNLMLKQEAGNYDSENREKLIQKDS